MIILNITDVLIRLVESTTSLAPVCQAMRGKPARCKTINHKKIVEFHHFLPPFIGFLGQNCYRISKGELYM